MRSPSRIERSSLRTKPMPEIACRLRGAVTVRSLLREAEQSLRVAGLAASRADAEWLLAGVLEVSRLQLYLLEEAIDDVLAERFRRQVVARIGGAPLQYLTGFTEFCSHRLAVDERVLIPRPETERLVELLIPRLRGRNAPVRVLELGTGSGAIAIALCAAVEACHVTAVELSWIAFQVANANVQAHRMGDRIALVQTDWTRGVRGRFDVIVSNPPYLASEELARLPADVQREPRMSLDGGSDGLVFYRRLLKEIPRLAAPGAVIALECGEEQARGLEALWRAQPWTEAVSVEPDLAGRPRALFIEISKHSEASG